MSDKLDEWTKKYPYAAKFSKTCYGIECGKGWDGLLEECVSGINAHLEAHPELQEGFGIDQIKEKFGGLRFYCHGGDETIRGIVRAAEKRAWETCEACGASGSPMLRGSWSRTLCGDCGKAQGYEIPENDPEEA